MSIFQYCVVYGKRDLNYNNQLFYCLVIHCKDGFNVTETVGRIPTKEAANKFLNIQT